MIKSSLTERLSSKNLHLSVKDVESGMRIIIDSLAETLAKKGRIEIRGFGSFSIRCRLPRTGRNPRTGEQVELPEKIAVHFKPGKELREKVNESSVVIS